jgi:hypothetical protein
MRKFSIRSKLAQLIAFAMPALALVIIFTVLLSPKQAESVALSAIPGATDAPTTTQMPKDANGTDDQQPDDEAISLDDSDDTDTSDSDTGDVVDVTPVEPGDGPYFLDYAGDRCYLREAAGVSVPLTNKGYATTLRFTRNLSLGTYRDPDASATVTLKVRIARGYNKITSDLPDFTYQETVLDAEGLVELEFQIAINRSREQRGFVGIYNVCSDDGNRIKRTPGRPGDSCTLQFLCNFRSSVIKWGRDGGVFPTGTMATTIDWSGGSATFIGPQEFQKSRED